MVLPDANVLLYAVNADAAQHQRAKAWLEHALGADEAVGFVWVVLLAFIRVATRPGLFPRPLATIEALSLVDDWLYARPATVVQPTTRHATVLKSLLVESGTAGNLVGDAHLAALAIEHGARVCSFDRDFARFAGVELFAPA